MSESIFVVLGFIYEAKVISSLILFGSGGAHMPPPDEIPKLRKIPLRNQGFWAIDF